MIPSIRNISGNGLKITHAADFFYVSTQKHDVECRGIVYMNSKVLNYALKILLKTISRILSIHFYMKLKCKATDLTRNKIQNSKSISRSFHPWVCMIDKNFVVQMKNISSTIVSDQTLLVNTKYFSIFSLCGCQKQKPGKTLLLIQTAMFLFTVQSSYLCLHGLRFTL